MTALHESPTHARPSSSFVDDSSAMEHSSRHYHHPAKEPSCSQPLLCSGCTSTSAASSDGWHGELLTTLEVPHIRQTFNWDCGLACVMMVLRGLGVSGCDYTLLRHLCPVTSVWTVDLAHLLRRFNLDVTFLTITIGLNPAYVEERFYVQHLPDDERRVAALFADAPRAGIRLLQRSLSPGELQDILLAGRHLIIALVDKRRLSPWLAAADMCLPALCGMQVGYTGHYVLLTAFDPQEQEFVVQDPSASARDLRVAATALHQARCSFGTDEDLLLIARPGTPAPSCLHHPL